MKARNHNMLITFKWIPGHRGAEGNEAADEQAKKAITIGSSNTHLLLAQLTSPSLCSKSAIKQAFFGKLKCKAQTSCQKTPCHAKLNKTNPTSPSNAYIKLISGLPRCLASMLTQLQTRHAPLAKFLHHISRSNSSTCPACLQEPETVWHLILHCPAHQNARHCRNTITEPVLGYK